MRINGAGGAASEVRWGDFLESLETASGSAAVLYIYLSFGVRFTGGETMPEELGSAKVALSKYVQRRVQVRRPSEGGAGGSARRRGGEAAGGAGRAKARGEGGAGGGSAGRVAGGEDDYDDENDEEDEEDDADILAMQDAADNEEEEEEDNDDDDDDEKIEDTGVRTFMCTSDAAALAARRALLRR